MLTPIKLTAKELDFDQVLFVWLNGEPSQVTLLKDRVKSPFGTFLVHIPALDIVQRYDADGRPYKWQHETELGFGGALLVEQKEVTAYVAVVRVNDKLVPLLALSNAALTVKIDQKRGELLYRGEVQLSEPARTLEQAWDPFRPNETFPDPYADPHDDGTWFGKRTNG